MTSMRQTTCPKCHWSATFLTDDGVTYCHDSMCKFEGAEYPDYKPPDRRGGVGENDPFAGKSKGV